MNEDRLIKTDLKLKGFGTGAMVVTDTETGVQYLFVASGYAGGMCVMVDADGKPLVDSAYAYQRGI